jgi:hypothetical protein
VNQSEIFRKIICTCTGKYNLQPYRCEISGTVLNDIIRLDLFLFKIYTHVDNLHIIGTPLIVQ